MKTKKIMQTEFSFVSYLTSQAISFLIFESDFYFQFTVNSHYIFSYFSTKIPISCSWSLSAPLKKAIGMKWIK